MKNSNDRKEAAGRDIRIAVRLIIAVTLASAVIVLVGGLFDLETKIVYQVASTASLIGWLLSLLYYFRSTRRLNTERQTSSEVLAGAENEE